MRFGYAMVMAGVLCFASLGFAQRPGGGMGRPSGAGAPGSVGRPSDVGPGTMGRSSDVGPNGHSSSAIGSQSPTTLLQNNSHLNTALTNALAKAGVTVPGGDLQSACSGFKNLGQCVAALHVAKNLDIPGGFDALKDKMMGKGAVNLGKAIQQLDPNVKAKAESKKATKQAKQDIKAAQSQS
jgi:hypothetical protein